MKFQSNQVTLITKLQALKIIQYTCVSSPRNTNVEKNIIDQSGAIGSCDTALGYAIKASPGPMYKNDIKLVTHFYKI